MKKDKAMSQPLFWFMNGLTRFISFFFVGYRNKSHYKIPKDKPVLVLSNHQTDIDSALINLSFNRLLHPVASDHIFKRGFMNWLMSKYGAIPKRKGASDMSSAISILKTLRAHKSVLLFPEGNRTYAEFQYPVAPGIAHMIKGMKPTLVLFNLHGGNGTRPRFRDKPRRGKFYGEIKKVLTYEEYVNIPDEELFKIIMDNIKVYDSESGDLYKSRTRAEYLERMFFVCPACGKTQTLYSKGIYINCRDCGFSAEFTEDLHLKCSEESVKFTRLLDWYNYQIKWVTNYEVPENKVIFFDKKVRLYTAEARDKRRLIARGNIFLDNVNLKIGGLSFALKDIRIASPVSGTKLLFTQQDNAYLVKGHKRFNPLKYVFMFNKLDTPIRENNVDKYFTLEEKY